MILGLNPLSIFFENRRSRLKIENGKHLLPSFLRRMMQLRCPSLNLQKVYFTKWSYWRVKHLPNRLPICFVLNVLFQRSRIMNSDTCPNRSNCRTFNPAILF